MNQQRVLFVYILELLEIYVEKLGNAKSSEWYSANSEKNFSQSSIW